MTYDINQDAIYNASFDPIRMQEAMFAEKIASMMNDQAKENAVEARKAVDAAGVNYRNNESEELLQKFHDLNEKLVAKDKASNNTGMALLLAEIEAQKWKNKLELDNIAIV